MSDSLESAQYDDGDEDEEPGIYLSDRTLRARFRVITALSAFTAVIAIAITTYIDRENRGEPTLRATLNSGLYVERLFMIAVVIALALAVYIGTRAGE